MSSKIIQNKNVIEVYAKGLQGDKGDTGKSAYEIAVENGSTTASTETAWIESLKGDAFTYNDFTAEQLANLKGPKGDKGDKGDVGKPFKFAKIFTSYTDMQAYQGTDVSIGDYVYLDTSDEYGGYIYVRNNISNNEAFTKVAYIKGKQGASGAKGDTGASGTAGVGIASIVETESLEDWGINKLNIYMTDTSRFTASIHNGHKGNTGDVIVPNINGTILSWTALTDNSSKEIPTSFDFQLLANNATSKATNGLDTDPVSIFESNLEEDTLMAENVEV